MATVKHSLKPQIMGILNVTPDSFWESSRVTPDQVLQRATQMVAAGATVLDIGGESTRPGAAEVGVQQECDRVLPILALLKQELDVELSVDTQKTQVMAEAINLGVGWINDVNALQAPGALQVVAASTCAVCLMHKQGIPATMQQNPSYSAGRVVETIYDFLQQRLLACEAEGMALNRCIVDPGIGFGKTLAHNLTIVRQLERFKKLGCRLLFGASRKTMIGELLHQEPADRLIGSVTLATLAYLRGADILRVHDVQATREALIVAQAVQEESFSEPAQ